MSEIEYQIVVRNHHEGEEEMLNQMGREGWELCSVRAVNVGGMIGGIADHFYFMRKSKD
jgi:hypothetical protein